MVDLDLDLFLKPEDVKDGITVEFLNEGEKISKEQTGFEQDSFNISIKLPDNSKRSWTMNKTSQRYVAGLYGIDTKKWLGKRVTLKTTDVNVRGVMKKAIYVTNIPTTPTVTTQKVA